MTPVALTSLDVTGPVQDALRDVARFVPKFVAFLLILVVGWLVARALRSVVDRLLRRVGFDRAAERGGVGRALAGTRYEASGLVAALVYYAVLLFTLELAFGVWGPNPVSDLIHGVVAWLPKAVVAIVIVVVASAIAAAVRTLISGALGGLSYGRLLANLAGAVIVGIGVIAALNQIGVATTVTTPVLIAVLATIAGILIVGVGGGLVRPMQERWERWLNRAEEELPAVREQLAAAAEERRMEAERQAEAERRAEAERQAEAERRAEEERQAEAARQAEAERQAEVARQAEAARQQAERVAEEQRIADEQRRAAEQAAAAAGPQPAAAPPGAPGEQGSSPHIDDEPTVVIRTQASGDVTQPVPLQQADTQVIPPQRGQPDGDGQPGGGSKNGGGTKGGDGKKG